MDLSKANYIVDTLSNAANDFYNLAQEERDVVVRDWLNSLSVALQMRSMDVLALPLSDSHPRKVNGAQEEPGFTMPGQVVGNAPIPEIPVGMSVSNMADGMVGH